MSPANLEIAAKDLAFGITYLIFNYLLLLFCPCPFFEFRTDGLDYSYGRLVRCDIPAPRTAASRLRFAFVEYESRRDADDAYHEMHNKRIGPRGYDEILKIEWARTPPSASWRFDSGRERDAPPRRRSPRRGGRSPSPRRSRGGDYSPRKDDRRDRDYERRDRDRSRSPEDREREVKEERDRDEGRDNGTNGEDRKVAMESPPPQTHDELDTAE